LIVRSFVSVRKSRSLNYCAADICEWKSIYGFESKANKDFDQRSLTQPQHAKRMGRCGINHKRARRRLS